MSLHAGINGLLNGVLIEITIDMRITNRLLLLKDRGEKLDAARQILLTADTLLQAESWLRDCLALFGDNKTS
jgi:hypothetical protein